MIHLLDVAAYGAVVWLLAYCFIVCCLVWTVVCGLCMDDCFGGVCFSPHEVRSSDALCQLLPLRAVNYLAR